MEIPDPVFRSYLLENFDKNDDGVLTIPEALTITEIDVCTDSIYSLRGIEKMSRLVRLTACGSEGYRGKLFEIDLSGNPLLEFFNLNDNFIASLDLSGLPNLQDICFATNPLASIDFSHNTRLGSIYMNNIPLRELPEMQFLPLWNLHFDLVACFMPADYPRHFPRLKGLNMGFYEGQTVDFSVNTQLEDLWAYGCPHLEELDLTATARLKKLYLGECPKLKHVLVRAGTVFEELEKDAHTEIRGQSRLSAV